MDDDQRRTALLIGSMATIFFVSILGVRSAIGWLIQSNANNAAEDRLLAGDFTAGSNSASQFTSQNSDPGSNSDGNPSGNQTPGLANDANRVVSPLEEAGTYVQRQQRVQEDSAIAQTSVDVVEVTDPSPTPSAQNDTTPTTPPPASTAPTERPAPSSVRALW